MVRALWISPQDAWPVSPSRAAALEGEIRQDTANILRKEFKLPSPVDDGEDEE